MKESCHVSPEFGVVLGQIPQRLSQCPVPNWCSHIPTAELLLSSRDGSARMLHCAGVMRKKTR